MKKNKGMLKDAIFKEKMEDQSMVLSKIKKISS